MSRRYEVYITPLLLSERLMKTSSGTSPEKCFGFISTNKMKIWLTVVFKPFTHY